MQPRANRVLAVRVARRILAVLDARERSPEWLAEVTGIAPRKLDRRLHPTAPAGLTVDELNAIAIALDVGLRPARPGLNPGCPGNDFA